MEKLKNGQKQSKQRWRQFVGDPRNVQIGGRCKGKRWGCKRRTEMKERRGCKGEDVKRRCKGEDSKAKIRRRTGIQKRTKMQRPEKMQKRTKIHIWSLRFTVVLERHWWHSGVRRRQGNKSAETCTWIATRKLESDAWELSPSKRSIDFWFFLNNAGLNDGR